MMQVGELHVLLRTSAPQCVVCTFTLKAEDVRQGNIIIKNKQIGLRIAFEEPLCCIYLIISTAVARSSYIVTVI